LAKYDQTERWPIETIITVVLSMQDKLFIVCI
jgi:hypothetical protein